MSTFGDRMGENMATILKWVIIVLLLWMALIFMPQWVQDSVRDLITELRTAPAPHK